jgi:hypothetical protein
MRVQNFAPRENNNLATFPNFTFAHVVPRVFRRIAGRG